LFLSQAVIFSAAACAEPNQITELYLVDKNIHELTQFIGMCKNLKKLNLNDNKISVIDHLQKLGQLLELNISFNAL